MKVYSWVGDDCPPTWKRVGRIDVADPADTHSALDRGYRIGSIYDGNSGSVAEPCAADTYTERDTKRDIGKLQDSGQAVIENGSLVIRVSMEALPMILEGAWAMNKLDTRYKITNAAEFAKELMHALNREDEQGTTPVHELFDAAILHVIEQGGFGIDEHETQEV